MSDGHDDAPRGDGRDAPPPARRPRGAGGRAVGAVRARLEPVAGRRPLSVYAVLVVGVATLLLLLAVIYFTASDRDQPPPICADIDATQAQGAILAGEVERLTVVYDEAARTPTSERFGPVLARLEYANGQCANLPQGISSQGGVYTLLGQIDFYNSIAESQSVAITYQRQTDLPAALFDTPTPPPTATVPVPATAPSTPPPAATGTPAPPTRVPVTPPPVSLDLGTPAAPPAATPRD